MIIIPLLGMVIEYEIRTLGKQAHNYFVRKTVQNIIYQISRSKIIAERKENLISQAILIEFTVVYNKCD